MKSVVAASFIVGAFALDSTGRCSGDTALHHPPGPGCYSGEFSCEFTGGLTSWRNEIVLEEVTGDSGVLTWRTGTAESDGSMHMVGWECPSRAYDREGTRFIFDDTKCDLHSTFEPDGISKPYCLDPIESGSDCDLLSRWYRGKYEMEYCPDQDTFRFTAHKDRLPLGTCVDFLQKVACPGESAGVSLAAAAPMSIVETAQSVPELSSLVDALVAADLVDTLSTDGPFTVFAPTNDAFAAISSVVEGLTKEQLQQVLEYHVVSGPAVTITGDGSTIINHQQLFPLFTGHSLGVSLDETDKIARIVGETVAVTVTTADVMCTNGVVHIVDAVLIPNLPAAAPTSMNIVETLAQHKEPELSSLVGALAKADLVDALSGDGPFTVFAPTNDAFASISIPGGGVLTMEHLQHLLQYHVVSGTVMARDLHNMDQLPTLFSEGRQHTIGVDLEEEGRIRIVGETKAVTVTMADVVCSNGVVHIVNAILMPDFESDILTV